MAVVRLWTARLARFIRDGRWLADCIPWDWNTLRAVLNGMCDWNLRQGRAASMETRGSVQDFLAAQEVELHLQANRRYASLLGILRQRIAGLVDFELIEPREFWRVAVREALAETNFDFNPIIEALFDPDSLGCHAESEADFIEQHLRAIEQRIYSEDDPVILAAAAVMLAVSLGYSPSEAMIESKRSG
jgi:hypothetical protein